MDVYQRALALHKKYKGKIETKIKTPLSSREDLTLVYTPGVAAPCEEIAANQDNIYAYTIKNNTVAVVTDGSAVLGLGNIGAHAALPVMEGKCCLFKEFGNVDAFPLCIDTQDVDEFIDTVVRIAPVFGGINLEDIAAPRCFEIEERLNNALDIPVFHDDQHGTAIVVLSAIINSLRLVGKSKECCKVVFNGAGSAGIAIAKLLYAYGFENIIMCDIDGVLSSTSKSLNAAQRQMLQITNKEDVSGSLADVMVGADIFVGVSAPGCVTPNMVSSMNTDSVVLALANPVPEINPNEAKAAGARIVCTGRSDYPNQVNNVIAFPGIFRGALDARVDRITEEMKLAAAVALAHMVSTEDLSEENIMPSPLDSRSATCVAKAVCDCSRGKC